MKKRLFGILLSFALMLTMMPVLGLSQTAYATSGTNYVFQFSLTTSHGTITGRSKTATLPCTLPKAEWLDLANLDPTSDISGATVKDGDENFLSLDGSKNLTINEAFEGSKSITGVYRPDYTVSITCEVKKYPIWVGGTQVTSDNLSGTGWSYDPSDNILTLNNADITTEDTAEQAGIYYNGTEALNIVLKGENKIGVNGNVKYGIYMNDKSIVISGDGSLTSKGSETGIGATGGQGNITIKSGTVNATGTGGNGIGVSNVTITGGTVTTDGTGAGANGISTNSVTITGGIVNATSVQSSGINSGSVTINGGTVNADGKGDVNAGAGGGIYAGSVTISGGTVNATSSATNGICTYGTGELNIGGGEVTASGAAKAVGGKVENGIAGTGWTNVEGTLGEENIEVSTAARELDYKKVQFPQVPAEVTKAPEVKTLTYTGSAQELVTAGTAKNGTMQYALGENATTAPTSGWRESIPTGTKAGTYYVWYKAKGDAKHSDSVPKAVTATIKGTDPAKESTITYDLNGGSLDGKSGTVTVKVENGTVITLPKPTRDGYTFDYWKGSKYNAGDKYTVNGDHTFKAVWKTAAGGNGSKGGSSKKGVNTGDENTLGAWIVLLVAALTGTTGMVFARKRRND